jgi:hypothetical protein
MKFKTSGYLIHGLGLLFVLTTLVHAGVTYYWRGTTFSRFLGYASVAVAVITVHGLRQLIVKLGGGDFVVVVASRWRLYVFWAAVVVHLGAYPWPTAFRNLGWVALGVTITVVISNWKEAQLYRQYT